MIEIEVVDDSVNRFLLSVNPVHEQTNRRAEETYVSIDRCT
ncbi:hypothetical protein [Bacillus sp. 3255]|nr:hypothetical protein [Bacillus sp. 3255]MDR6883350.1 hypothetical protein [Bacillus sp. 3255]